MVKKLKKNTLFGGNPVEAPLRVVMPTELSKAVAQATGARTPLPFAVPQAKENWANLDSFADELAGLVYQNAQSVMQTVQMVTQCGGVDNPKEFARAVSTAEADLLRFSDELNKIRTRHQGKVGEVQSADDLTHYLSVFEDYVSFNAFFQGTFQHTMIVFTEYALQAKDRMITQRAQAGDQEATELLAAAPANSQLPA
jgi:hypothetical protein